MDIDVIMADAQVTFRAPVQFGIPVNVGVRTSKIGNKSMTVEQNIVNAETGEVLASGQVTLVAFDYRTNKSMPVPDVMREVISKFEGLEV